MRMSSAAATDDRRLRTADGSTAYTPRSTCRIFCDSLRAAFTTSTSLAVLAANRRSAFVMVNMSLWTVTIRFLLNDPRVHSVHEFAAKHTHPFGLDAESHAVAFNAADDDRNPQVGEDDRLFCLSRQHKHCVASMRKNCRITGLGSPAAGLAVPGVAARQSGGFHPARFLCQTIRFHWQPARRALAAGQPSPCRAEKARPGS